jgi:RND family efflux transporter MFP subunit
MKSAKSVILLLCSLVSGGAAAEERAGAVVEVATVTEIGDGPVLRLPGTVISRQDAEISAELSGRLTWIAEVGARIGQGEPLAIIDDHLLKLQLRNDRAAIERIRADITFNERQAKRLERLAHQNNTAQADLDAVSARLQMLAQELLIAEVDRDRTLYDLGRSRVQAPFDGVVASRAMAAGEYSEPGETLLRLVDTESLEISVNAPLRATRYNRPGGQVEVEGGERRQPATIRGIVPVGDARSHMMELRIGLQPGHWQIGEAVTVELPDGTAHTALGVPRDALVLRDQEVWVYTLSDDGRAVKVPVTTGAGQGERIAVEGQLQAGDPVVVRGAERLREGQAVRVIRYHLAAQ